jgi:thymidylate kinase
MVSNPHSLEHALDQESAAARIILDEQEPRASSVELTLFAALERERIRYCHWKSNVRLGRTLAGLEDIDVLVHPSDADAFQRVINECGFKLTVSRLGAGHPGVFHALALDPESCRLLDLHAYHQLISGDSFVKSFRFPIEENFLARTTSMMGVRVPDPSSELVLFLLRILLKHINLIEIYKVDAHYDECRDELAWLLRRADVGEAAALCEDWFPSSRIPLQQMIDCVAKGTLPARMRMGTRLARELRHQRRLGHTAAGCSRLMRLTKHYAVRSRGGRHLSLLSGGAWIALVGPKGTGKSTLVKLLAKRLGKSLNVQTMHVGKPPATWMSFVPRLILPALRKVAPNERLREYQKPERRAERRYSILFVIGKLLVAFDRQRLLTRAVRSVASGTIVISDRCPATNATGLDGSAFDDLAVACEPSPIKRRLMEWERNIYRRLPTPRLVLKLTASIETALERDLTRNKAGGPDPLAIHRRWAFESGAEYAGSVVCPIDTDGDIDETLQAAVSRVWQSL